MKASELMEQLKDIDPEAVVVMSGYDHSFQKVSSAVELTADHVNRGYYEYFEGDDVQGEPVKVVFID